MSVFSRLYQGETNVDFIGRKKIWYAFSGALILVSFVTLIIRGGFNLGVDFTGGAVFEFKPAAGVQTDVSDVRETVAEVVSSDPIVEKIGSGQGSYRVKTKALTQAEVDEVSKAIADKYGVEQDSINPTSVSPTWGDQITHKALLGLVVFLALVILYISMRFEPKMAIASIAALFHDILITAGIYALIGFEVTPSTVIAFLTILGYSLYDNIVVFDKVRENTVGLAGSNRMTYTEAANLSINQTIMRSINTTLTSLLPVGSLLFVGVFLLGAGSLKDLSLSLFVGMAAGAYSSVFFATPILVTLKEREPQYKALAARIASRQAAAAGRAGAPALATAGGGTARRSRPVQDAVVQDAVVQDAVEDAPPARPAAKKGGSKAQQQRPGAKRKGGRGGKPTGKKRR